MREILGLMNPANIDGSGKTEGVMAEMLSRPCLCWCWALGLLESFYPWGRVSLSTLSIQIAGLVSEPIPDLRTVPVIAVLSLSNAISIYPIFAVCK